MPLTPASIALVTGSSTVFEDGVSIPIRSIRQPLPQSQVNEVMSIRAGKIVYNPLAETGLPHAWHMPSARMILRLRRRDEDQ
jgi:hypothetical protein